YCTTWGCPSAENVRKIIKAIDGFQIGTFVIDAGWYKPDGKGWCNAIGDWNESAELFPQGIREAVREIRAAGMRAGIWFEFEVAGRDSACFRREDLLLKRDGSVITCKNRRFLDLRKAEVKEYLNERFLSLIKENGFEYLKIDYNDAYGIGCDGAESLGEGWRRVSEESIGWLNRFREEMPDLVIENCASGGSRIEPLRMRKVSMCSFSDAHECAEIPLVAANLSRVIPARQMQIWAVLREGESDARTVYSLCAAMLGRICLSGDVLVLSKGKRTLIDTGLGFYRRVCDVVRYGDVVNIDCNVKSYRDPEGFQVYEKKKGKHTLIIIHNLNGERVL
ncbi:MAG: alpha-galactosidase, partial [Clostridia bacterium]|nr:alpha-galactosidase [Clostridia bacterium]